MGPMSEEWSTVSAGDVRPGDRIRLATGQVLEVSTIETAFMGRPDMVAFIEDTPERWYKQPMPGSATVEVNRS